MIWLAVCLSMLVPLCTVAVLAFLGFRGGDHPGDAMLELGEPDGHRAVVKASVVNPSKVPVLVGLSVRGRDIRRAQIRRHFFRFGIIPFAQFDAELK